MQLPTSFDVNNMFTMAAFDYVAYLGKRQRYCCSVVLGERMMVLTEESHNIIVYKYTKEFQMFEIPHIYFPTLIFIFRLTQCFQLVFFFFIILLQAFVSVCLCLSCLENSSLDEKTNIYHLALVVCLLIGFFHSQKLLWVSHGPHYYFSLRYIWLSSVSEPSIPLLEQHPPLLL